MSTIDVDADTTKAEAKLREIDRERQRVINNFATNVRRTAEVTLYMMEASGFAIDTVLRLSIETGLRVIEFISAVATAESLTTMGASGLLRLGAQAAAIALMVAQIVALTQMRTEAARRLGLAASGLRVMTF